MNKPVQLEGLLVAHDPEFALLTEALLSDLTVNLSLQIIGGSVRTANEGQGGSCLV